PGSIEPLDRGIHQIRYQPDDGCVRRAKGGAVLEKVTTPGRTVLRAAARPETYVAQVREATSLAVTAAIWPFGWLDRGLAELRSRVAADRSPVATPVLMIHGYGANKSNWFF